jgi:Zn-dependent M28 family amino/carboxypeptidase/uncharacterized protein (DUF1684 family)
MPIMRRRASTVFVRCLLAAVCTAWIACSAPESKAPANAAADPKAAAHPIHIADLPQIDVAAVLAHVKTLSSDEFEGRGPGTRGEERTVKYLVDQFQKMGLKPGNTDGTYIQNVPLVGITPAPASIVLERNGLGVEPPLRWKDDLVAWTKHVAPTASLDRSELVFVGYGVVAPEYGWDDYKGLDVRGKTLVMLIGDPPVASQARPSELDPKIFGGKAMTYYGRWTYKFEIAAEKGAAGALIIHETESAGYPFDVVQSSWDREQFDLVTPDRNMQRASIEGWIALDRGRDLLKTAGQDFHELKKQAATRDFRPVPLGIRASMTIHNTLRTIASKNVVARLEGADPALKDDHIVYTAHWDHLGIGRPINGDAIYNGAQDNATGTAGLLEIARMYTKLQVPPKRSILFLSVTAEEQGLLGSAYYARFPIYPLAKTLANINMDGLNVHGRTKDLTIIGYGASDLDDYARDAAAEQGRELRPDPEPEKGFYYRSDHFSLAKEGVPALDPDAGVVFVGKPLEYGEHVRREYTEHNYHKPSDEVKPDWDLSGAGEDLQLFFAIGYRLAQAQKAPAWKPGNEFKAKREAMLAHAKEIDAWRAKHEADYTREYVPLAGLFFLKPGANTAGSARSADIVLPDRTPASIGRFVYQQDQRVRFEPAPGAPVTLKGKAVTSPLDLHSDDETTAFEELEMGDVAFWLHESGARRTIRIRDPQSGTARSFAGFHWFPVDEHYRVIGTFIKDPAPHQVKVASLTGDDQTYTTEGIVEFELEGERVRMRPMTTRPGRLYFIFRDGTSGHETYEAARFLYADLNPNGTTVLDFNQAYNPPCSFNPFTTCPLPPQENRLKIRIPVGEKAYAGQHAALSRPSR